MNRFALGALSTKMYYRPRGTTLHTSYVLRPRIDGRAIGEFQANIYTPTSLANGRSSIVKVTVGTKDRTAIGIQNRVNLVANNAELSPLQETATWITLTPGPDPWNYEWSVTPSTTGSIVIEAVIFFRRKDTNVTHQFVFQRSSAPIETKDSSGNITNWLWENVEKLAAVLSITVFGVGLAKTMTTRREILADDSDSGH